MKRYPVAAALAACMFAAQAAHAADTTAPASPSTAGTLVVVPADGEVTRANDQATLVLLAEEVDQDKAAAASRVNQKMRQGLELVRKADPRASLKTQGYYTYPVYPDAAPLAPGQPARPRVPTAWRVGQTLQVVTSNLAGLSKTVAATQAVLTVSYLNFGVAPDTARQLDEQRIAAAYRNLQQRVVAIAAAMGRQPGEAVLESVEFEGAGSPRSVVAHASNVRAAGAPVAEPSFEPGETTLHLRLVGKVRFK